MQIYKDLPLSEILWYKIGGAAKYVLEAQSKTDILQALEFINKNNITKYLVVGIGANLLVADTYFDGAVIKLNREESTRHITKKDNIITAFAGELLDDVIQYSFAHNLVGLEWAGGLPSSVGGAIRGNVGAFGHEIMDSFVSAQVIEIGDTSHQVKTYSKDDMAFAYRTSIIKQQKNFIVVSSSFSLQAVNEEGMQEAKNIYYQNNEYRRINHPIEYPSCGSTFKNIIEKEKIEKVLSVFPDLKEKIEKKWHGKVSTGHLITKLGLCGYKVGNAQASEKHPNFIVNLGGASFTDVYTIIQTIQQKFTQTFGFSPELEVEIVQ